MTREEFMTHAKREIDAAFNGNRNRLMNLVEQAWAEGKKNAEADQVEAILREALKRFEPPETVSAEPEKCDCWHAIPTGMKREEGTFEYRCWGTPERDICTCGWDKEKQQPTDERFAELTTRMLGEYDPDDAWVMEGQPKDGLVWYEETGSGPNEYVYAWLPMEVDPAQVELPKGVKWG